MIVPLCWLSKGLSFQHIEIIATKWWVYASLNFYCKGYILKCIMLGICIYVISFQLSVMATVASSNDLTSDMGLHKAMFPRVHRCKYVKNGARNCQSTCITLPICSSGVRHHRRHSYSHIMYIGMINIPTCVDFSCLVLISSPCCAVFGMPCM